MNIILSIMLTLLVICAAKRQMITIDRHDFCDISPSAPIKFDDCVLKTINHQTYVNCSFYLSRNIKKLKIYAELTRCSSKENLNSCQYYGRFQSFDSCVMLAERNTMYSSMTYTYTPPLKCPLKKGRYVQTNGHYNASRLYFPMEGYYWKAKQEFWDINNKEYLFTLCVDAQIITIFK